MTPTLFVPSEIERKLATVLRDRSVQAIKQRNDLKAVAAELGLTPQGVESLLWHSEWPLERAVRVAEALKVIDAGMADRLIAEKS